jgi:hypothetical protein
MDKEDSLHICRVKVDVRAKSSLEQAMKAQSGGRVIALLSFNLGARWGGVVKATPRPLYPGEGDTAPFVEEARWTPGPSWTGTQNLSPAGIRFPHRPVRSESLYRLSYSDPQSEGWVRID